MMIKNKAHIIILAFLFLGKPFEHIAALEVSYPEISGQGLTATSTIADFVRYLFNAGMFLGFFAVFLSLTIAGIMYFLSPVNVEMRTNAKDRFYGAISGLLILVLTYLILTTINPQLTILSVKGLDPVLIKPEKKASGVYFYRSAGCSDKKVFPKTGNVFDFSEKNNKINFVNIINDTANSYVTILYENTNFWGRCLYIGNANCKSTIEQFAASASIHTYDYTANGDGVYFFRKSCFDGQTSDNIDDIIKNCEANSGGYYKIPNAEMVGKNYVGELEKLKFENVPEKEQTCTKYDEKEMCTERTPQSLGGENISSMVINGNYIVMLVYLKNSDDRQGIWTSCQEFPVPSDINRIGPQQIKWQNIRNNGTGAIPNYVIVIPVKQK